MGANRAGENLRRKRKRHLKNIQTQVAAFLRSEAEKVEEPKKKK